MQNINIPYHDTLENLLGAYFNQDFTLEYGNLENALKTIFLHSNCSDLQFQIFQINSKLEKYKTEDELRSYFINEADFELDPEDLNFSTYHEFLLYLKNEFQKHIDAHKDY